MPEAEAIPLSHFDVARSSEDVAPGAVVAEAVSSSPAVRLAQRTRRLLKYVLTSFGTWGLVDQGIVSLVSFLASIVVGRVSGPEQLGIYHLALVLFWLLAGLPNALIWIPYTSRSPRLPPDRRRVFTGSATTHLLVITACLCAGFLVAAIVGLALPDELAWVVPVSLVLIPFSFAMLVREHLRRLYLAQMRVRELLLVDVPFAVLQVVLLGGLYLADALTAISVLISTALSSMWAVGWLWYFRRDFPLFNPKTRLHWNANFLFGRWLLFVSAAWLVGDAAFRWMVASMHGLTVFGQFAAAAMIVLFLNPIFLTVQNLARALLAKCWAQGDLGELWRETVKGTVMLAIGFGVLFACLAAVGGYLTELVYGDKYSGLSLVVASLCLGMFFQVLNCPVEAALSALQAGRPMVVASALRLGVILSLGALLIGFIGPVGVGIAMAASALAASAVQWCYFFERYRHAA